MMDEKDILDKIEELIKDFGGDPESFEGSLIQQMIHSSLKLINAGYNLGQLKLINRALKEIRYAYRIFNSYGDTKMVSVFGSARTPTHHPDYLAAKEFAAKMAKEGWMCITGAAEGIMQAGIEGSSKDSSFGLSIRLPFENVSNKMIEGDPKLIVFRYFFTRKLMFVSHSHALAAFPGGYGTLDELFEVLTLMQTGKSAIVPILLMQGKGGEYWQHWKHYLDRHLLTPGWIHKEDIHLFKICQTVDDGIEEIKTFYHNYHSSRYVGDHLVIRLKHALSIKNLRELNIHFHDLVGEGKIVSCPPFPEETDHLELPRISFIHTRKAFARLRLLINQINSC